MQYQQKKKIISTQLASYLDPIEKDRLLKQYVGIFKNSIKELGESIKKHKQPKNYSR